MAVLHLTKVAVSCASLAALEARNAERSVGGERRVVTRMRPRRADELIGGCLFWIVKHRLVARQQILRIEDRPDGRIDFVCSAELVAIAPVHRRAHQGWRYLEQTALNFEPDSSGAAELPPRLYGKLTALALV